jgi:hypothetical protein
MSGVASVHYAAFPLDSGSERACAFETAAAECTKRLSGAKAALEELYLTPGNGAHRAALLKQEAAVSHALQIQRQERKDIYMLYQVHQQYAEDKDSNAEDSKAEGDEGEQKARRLERRVEARARLSNLTTAIVAHSKTVCTTPNCHVLVIGRNEQPARCAEISTGRPLVPIDRLTVRVLKERLAEAGVGHVDCVEKSDLVAKLTEHKERVVWTDNSGFVEVVCRSLIVRGAALPITRGEYWQAPGGVYVNADTGLQVWRESKCWYLGRKEDISYYYRAHADPFGEYTAAVHVANPSSWNGALGRMSSSSQLTSAWGGTCEVCAETSTMKVPARSITTAFVHYSNRFFSEGIRGNLHALAAVGSKGYKEGVEEVPEWACSQCTFDNDNSSSTCGICGGPKPEPSIPSDTGGGASEWSCSACTYMNSSSFAQCSMCDAPQQELTATGPSVFVWRKDTSEWASGDVVKVHADGSLDVQVTTDVVAEHTGGASGVRRRTPTVYEKQATMLVRTENPHYQLTASGYKRRADVLVNCFGQWLKGKIVSLTAHGTFDVRMSNDTSSAPLLFSHVSQRLVKTPQDREQDLKDAFVGVQVWRLADGKHVGVIQEVNGANGLLTVKKENTWELYRSQYALADLRRIAGDEATRALRYAIRANDVAAMRRAVEAGDSLLEEEIMNSFVACRLNEHHSRTVRAVLEQLCTDDPQRMRRAKALWYDLEERAPRELSPLSSINNGRDKNTTLLHLACGLQVDPHLKVELVEWLLRLLQQAPHNQSTLARALDFIDCDGNTPMHIACARGDAGVWKALVEAGVDARAAKDRSGRTAIEIAAAAGHAKLAMEMERVVVAGDSTATPRGDGSSQIAQKQRQEIRNRQSEQAKELLIRIAGLKEPSDTDRPLSIGHAVGLLRAYDWNAEELADVFQEGKKEQAFKRAGVVIEAHNQKIGVLEWFKRSFPKQDETPMCSICCDEDCAPALPCWSCGWDFPVGKACVQQDIQFKIAGKRIYFIFIFINL